MLSFHARGRLYVVLSATALALAACTPGGSGTATPTPVPSGTTAQAPTTSSTPTEAPTSLLWADGTPVTGPTLDLADAQSVTLGTHITHVATVTGEPGKRVYIEELRDDGSYLAIGGDAEPSGDGSGTYFPVTLVTDGVAQTLRSPDDIAEADRAPIGLVTRIGGATAWVEQYYERTETLWRLVRAEEGQAQGTVVAEGVSDEDYPGPLLASGLALSSGARVAWDGTLTAAPAGSDDLRPEPMGDDVLETRCNAESCELVTVAADGSEDTWLRGPAGIYVTATDAHGAVVNISSGSDDVTWFVDRDARTATQIIGGLLVPQLSGGRIVVEDGDGIVVVDAAAGTVERLDVGRRVVTVAIADELIAWTATDFEDGIGTDGDGGAVVRWPRD